MSGYEQLYSVILDGIGDAINTNDTFQSTFRGSFSVSCWINLDDSTPNPGQFFWGSINAAGAGGTNKIYTGISNNYWYFYFKANNTVGSVQVATGFSGNDPTGWINLLVTCENADPTGSGKSPMVMYLNGSQAGATTSITGANHTAFTIGNDLMAGCFNNNNAAVGLPIAGKISDFAIWEAALDADAVEVVYNSGKPFDLTLDRTTGVKVYDNASDLVSYYKMNDGSGTTVVDSMGNSNGSLVADATFSAVTPDD